jgi:hypothetical protein
LPIATVARREAFQPRDGLERQPLGRQDHTISPSASLPLVKRAHPRPPQFRTTFRDDA